MQEYKYLEVLMRLRLRFTFLGLFLLGLAGCQQVLPSAGPSHGLQALVPLKVRIQVVTPALVATSIDYAATVKARRQAVLSTKLHGLITDLQVEEGDVVTRGQVLAYVDATDLKARTDQAQAGVVAAQAGFGQAQAGRDQAQQAVAQAQAQFIVLGQQQGEAKARVQVAQKDAERYERLAQEGAVPRQQAEHARAELLVARSRQAALNSQLKAAQVAIDQAQTGVARAQSTETFAAAQVELAAAGVNLSSADLAYAQVLAPFRGVVVEKLAFEGELNTPGRPLLRLQDLDSLEVVVSVPEAGLKALEQPGALSGFAPALKQELKLALREVVASTDPLSRSVQVRLKLGDAPFGLLPGSYVRVSVKQPPERLLRVAAANVVQRGHLEGVFVVSATGKAQFRLLQLSEPQDGFREVLSGLKAGETIVIEPTEEVSDGRELVMK